uniref:RNA polymerase-associated protein n=1 Tax=Candidatus Kentrum sp. LFY TaxID=2126342 RepID=A0A450V297_9GAMM|nr:MAG: RNA polymerase-associated protein [Candidatus Kentron sp. LFY]VFJ98928.1 MAG: RNA polymerase-associated protein [Candidatus Kentron sp. LFY]VFK23635.1 MAG: RNA polymerase-associated protein [Candidatus Kentron sp. LFY]
MVVPPGEFPIKGNLCHKWCIDLGMSSLANRRSVMSLYSDAVCPVSHAVRFVLAEKAINVEIHNIIGDERPEDLIELNPYNNVLTLVDRDLVLYEAQIIMEYLDERFPHPPLMPVDPVARANNRQYRYRFAQDIYAILPNLTQGGRDQHVNTARKKLRDRLVSIAAIFAQTPYFMADDYSLVDCYLAPILWRIPYYNVKLPKQAKPLVQYADRLFRREAFRRSLTGIEQEMREL